MPSTVTSLLAHATVFAASLGVVEATIDALPPWKPTYNMSLSTLVMTCNSSGFSNPERGAQFGIVSYDWSNAKSLWAASKPMDCEELLLEQATRTKKLNPDAHVFVYRNLVKALPWFSSVREKLDDPRYEGFFLKFAPNGTTVNGSYHVPNCAPENSSKCSIFYHDQEQTPEVPTKENPNPDGSCTDNECDCGVHPCGEYLWDHRNGSMLREFLVDEIVMGSTAVGSPVIDGLFIDDFWCSDAICKATNNTYSQCPCNDPVQGPTEVDKYSQVDMGLSDTDIAELTIEWGKTLEAAQQRILQNNGYTWSLFHNQYPANAAPVIVDAQTCDAVLSEACSLSPSNVWQTTAMLQGFRVNNSDGSLAHGPQDMATFLLARGDYAYLGWGVWGMGWPFNPEPAHGTVPPQPTGIPRYFMMDADYGEPVDKVCRSLPNSSHTYRREWSKVMIELNCSSYEAVFAWKNGTTHRYGI